MSKSKYRQITKKELDIRFAMFMSETFDSPPIWDHRYHTFIKQFRMFMGYFNRSPDYDYVAVLRSIDFEIKDKHLPKHIIK